MLMVSLVNGISTLFRLFNAKAILLKEQLWYYLTHSWKDTGVYIFPKGICPKVNVIARLEYELAYYDSAVHRFNHYTTRTPSNNVENHSLMYTTDIKETLQRRYKVSSAHKSILAWHLFFQARNISE